ncbi:MAG: DUF4276 family protein [Verrucomicrobia bacterium]|nr:DUF4276 family protein [Verrucomicrobiota bacterium]
MVSKYIYIEGGGTGADSKDVDIACREGFRRLLENCGFQGQMPRLVACGGRDAAFDAFKRALAGNPAGNFLALWIDSEEPLENLEAAWNHLQLRDKWAQPSGAVDEQVLFMTTCMETWFVADRSALKAHFKDELQDSALPPLNALESRSRHDVQIILMHATRNCTNAYTKGKRSFEVPGKLNPAVLEQHLPSFVRVRRILNARL